MLLFSRAPSLAHRPSLCLLPLIAALAACSGNAPTTADSTTLPAAYNTPSGSTRLAIGDCASAEPLFGERLEGLVLMDPLPAGDDVALNCTWSDPEQAVPMRLRTITLTASLGQHLAKDTFDDHTIRMSGMHRIPAPALERHGGLAFAKTSDAGVMGTGSQFHAQLADAHVQLLGTFGSEVPAARHLDDALGVQVATGLLGL